MIKNCWSPSFGLGGIKAQSKPLFSLPSWSFDSEMVVLDIAYGAAAGGLPFAATPFCSSPEVKLALGLGLTGLFWAFTGRNYFGISGAVTSIGLYALCKLSPSLMNVKVEVPPQTAK